MVHMLDIRNDIAKKYFAYQLGRMHGVDIRDVKNYENAISKEGRVDVYKRQESDIDIALIVNTSREGSVKYRKKMAELMSDISLEFDMLVSISCIPQNDFETYKEVLPYYRNINKEGVRLSA